MSIFADIAGIVGSVAPTIAGALGSPIAGTALGALSKALGIEGSTPDAVQQAVAQATPEQLLAIKQAEQSFAVQMEQLNIDLAKVNAGDRDSARQREMAVKDWVPGVLAVSLTIGFFGLLGWMMYQAPPAGSRDILNVMLGSLGTGWVTMLAYYFGSSASSDKMAMKL